MASPVAAEYPQPISSPPPVYLRSSPPLSPSQSQSTPRSIPSHRPSQSIARKAVPFSRPGSGHPASPPVQVLDKTNSAEVSNSTIERTRRSNGGDFLPTMAFTNISLDDEPQPRQTDNGTIPPAPGSRRHGHTPANSGSWSVIDHQLKDETGDSPKPGTSSAGPTVPGGSQKNSSSGSLESETQNVENFEPLHYHHRPYRNSRAGKSPAGSGSAENLAAPNGHLSARRQTLARPTSTYSIMSDMGGDGRNLSPHASPYLHARASPRDSSSPDVRPLSFVDLLNTSYPQPGPAPAQMDNSHLKSWVGNNASLLSHKQTFDMYLANVKKTDSSAIQYEFAVFMVNAMLEMPPEDPETRKSAVYDPKGTKITREGLLKEAKSILQGLANRSYPFAQYYLADGYASGLFSKGKEDYDRAFPLFVAASKHGHVEACYRTALCYEFGWGTRVEAARAQQFYRQAASKNHPGAMLRMAKACLAGDMGLGKRYREGVKWLKRAAESSDAQYNSAPYELGLLHETGYGDDVFPDPAYAAQLFTKSADLGHAEASYRLGDAYEHGKLECPRDPALSIHFYTNAAQGGHVLAMMALCAWYLVGAEPVLEKDEGEAYEWAKRAAELGLAKAQYAVGYFTEMGIGCRRDPLEANVWYVRAADQGDERAKHRIATIRAAADGASSSQNGQKEKQKSLGKPSL
ncbi:putative chitin synthase activator (Chs3) [Aspergillus clavatus NRRL 1]|uniref:Chitin synthase activator (Chs3), putative n=1 Tax=Aspergillus clavatus (strain ATCC 1007 / CBS 513.65 / DSM 816 / NCTC 3887 / NRRL 1 / QM 1276 / 107) TaxID=344612 RepID=A1C4A1_ASPCL|nr:chitin synthase activator (Chs3), putative [Aspergillus clavatus NRRL 1]EAW15241.1 chitin synthase activator (Chs3), putative [Aspergillus clavatus NRRL 1]